jgi:hypothetical protein
MIMATTVTPQQAADALGISLWDLAIAQSTWASDHLGSLVLDVTSNRMSTLEDFDEFVSRARNHWEGALETMKVIGAEDD